MRCIECGKFPFCEFIENPQEKACERSIKKPIGKGDVVYEQKKSVRNSKR